MDKELEALEAAMSEEATLVDDTEATEEKPADDTEQETSTDDTEQEPSEETESEDVKLLRQYGVNKYNTVEDALRSISQQDATITQAQQENARLRQLYADAHQPKERPEDETSPDDYVTKRDLDALKQGLLERSEQEKQFEQQLAPLQADPEMQDVVRAIRYGGIETFPRGRNRIWDKMAEIHSQYPSERPPMGMLYEWAKASLGNEKPSVPPVSPAKKLRASTAAAQPGGKPGETEPDFMKMSLDEIEAWHKKRGLYTM